MLTIGKEWIHENVSDEIELRLAGQELNPHTYSVCKSDMMNTGENPDNVRLGNSLSEDRFSGDRFDYMITNPDRVNYSPTRNSLRTRVRTLTAGSPLELLGLRMVNYSSSNT